MHIMLLCWQEEMKPKGITITVWYKHEHKVWSNISNKDKINTDNNI